MPFWTIIDFGDTTRSAEQFAQGATRVVETEGVMSRVAEDMMRIEEIIFNSEGRRGGGSWKRLKPDTVRKKGNSQILRGTSNPVYEGSNAVGANALLKSLTEPGAQFQILHVTDEVLEFGTDRPYAEVQAEGGGQNVPARPFMNFLDSDVEKWSDWFYDHVMTPFITPIK